MHPVCKPASKRPPTIRVVNDPKSRLRQQRGSLPTEIKKAPKLKINLSSSNAQIKPASFEQSPPHQRKLFRNKEKVSSKQQSPQHQPGHARKDSQKVQYES